MRKLSYLSVIASTMLLSSCALNSMIKLAEQQDLTVTPKPLEVHADSVKFEMSAVLPVKMLPSGKVYTVNTFYKYGGQEKSLDGLEFQASYLLTLNIPIGQSVDSASTVLLDGSLSA